MEITKHEFLLKMDAAIKEKLQYVVMVIKMPTYPTPEFIINHLSNFELKKDYINLIYDEALEHKHAEGIRVIEVVTTNSLESINELIQSYQKDLQYYTN